MASVVKCYPIRPPEYQQSGTATPTYTGTWLIEVDQVLSGLAVVQLGQQQTGPDKLPNDGEQFAHTAPGDGTKSGDSSAFALDFSARLREEPEDNPMLWEVDVTWRAPTPGQDEQPKALTLKPLQRPPEYKIEYGQFTKTMTDGALVTNVANGTLATLGGRMENSAGDAFPPVDVPILRPELIVWNNVKSELIALERNEKYEFSTNEDEFTILGKKIARHHARFLKAATGNRLHNQGVSYYRMETRIELSREPYYLNRFNEGEFFKDANGKRVRQLDEDGYPIPGPYPLKTDGTLATTTADYNTRPFLVMFEAPFKDLF